jgi:hypothetical protein
MARPVEAVAPSARTAGVDEAPSRPFLDGFGECYFPGRRRHDLEVLTAFAKYVAAS